MKQKLHLRQILTETEDGELEIKEIESENTELNDELLAQYKHEQNTLAKY